MNSYDEALRRFDQLAARDSTDIAPESRSLLMTHGRQTDRSVLLLHGLTASPKQFEALGQLLFERGFNVVIPRLPRHGRTDRLTQILAELEAHELLARTQEGLVIARGLGERVTVAGLSVGGLLTAWLAQREPVERAVSIAPFLGVAWIPLPLMSLVAWMAVRAPNRFVWWDPIARERQMPAHGYPRYATHAVAKAYGIARELFLDAARNRPAAKHFVLVTNARETSISNAAAGKLIRLWKKSGADAILHHHITGLPLSHDIIEPLRLPEVVKRVYPVLVDLIDR